MSKKDIPVSEKLNLTIEEAAEYSGLGINRVRTLAANPLNNFVLHVGTKILIKRKRFEAFLDSQIEV